MTTKTKTKPAKGGKAKRTAPAPKSKGKAPAKRARLTPAQKDVLSSLISAGNGGVTYSTWPPTRSLKSLVDHGLAELKGKAYRATEAGRKHHAAASAAA